MKSVNILRGYSGLQAFFPVVKENVQEAAPTLQVRPAVASADAPTYRPRVLSQRAARTARRAAH
jgi:hypothetical protein